VRQRLESEAVNGEELQARAITCSGPNADHDSINISYNWLTNSRICLNKDGRSENRAKAPLSDAIFVLANNRNKR
jgi:hypothetical protein